MALALPLIGAAASLAGGISQAQSLKNEAASLERKARDEGIKGKQLSAIRREQRNEVLATINAVRASRGIDIDSPGSVNFSQHNRDRSDENEAAELLGIKNNQETLKTQAVLRRRQAPFAILGSVSNAASSLSSLIPTGE